MDGNNFRQWSKRFKMAVTARGKLDFLTGEEVEPDKEKKPKEHKQWRSCNAMVQSWILNGLTPELSEAFLYSDNAHALWTELLESFNTPYNFLRYELFYNLSNCVQGQDSIGAYYTKFLNHWNANEGCKETTVCTDCQKTTLCTDCLKWKEEEKLMKFLIGVNESFESVITQILLMDPLPSTNNAYFLLRFASMFGKSLWMTKERRFC